MAISKSGKILAQFNVKNGQYKTADGQLASLTWLTKVSLDKNLATQTIYGDGEPQLTIINDKGFTGTLGMTARDDDFEKANGIQMEITGGSAEVQQKSVKENAIYFETEYTGSDGVTKVKKVWLFGVEVSTPNESLDQNTDGINISTVEYPITVKGTYLKATGGASDYVDATTGQKVKVFKVSAVPTDTGYSTFGDAVPTPTAIAAGGT
jgi:hypothetical protein